MPGSAFYAAISGLKSQQIKLDVIANNIANLNTFGFKSSRVAFSDLLSQTLRAASAPQGGRGGTNPIQVGLGVQLAGIDTLISQGSIQTTGNMTDLAINGEGTFIVSDGASTFYTRAGNFSLDADGALITSNGMRVLGYTQLAQDGTTIDTSTTLNDITVNFGEKLAGRPTGEIVYRSNLDSASYTYGSAELQTAGSTGLTVASGISVPIASYTGTQSNIPGGFPGTLPASGANDFVLNGQNITLNSGATIFNNANELAQYVADQINLQSTTVYARVGTSGNVVLQNLFGGAGNDVIIAGDATTPGYLAYLGLAAGTFTAPDASSALAGTHTIVINDAVAATATTITPVQAGALAGGAANAIQLLAAGSPPSYVSITYGATDASNTSAQNAQEIANAINAANLANPNLFITATANANGTITLTSDLAGVSNVIQYHAPVAGTDITGLETIGTDMGGGVYLVNNGEDATATNTFLSSDGTITWARSFSDATSFGTASSLDNLAPMILGDDPPLPLIPGVALTAEILAPGQAIVVTHDAFEHQTSINAYDSLGNAHQLTLTFKHTDANEWEWEATLPDEPQYALTNASGVIAFGTSGLINTINPTAPITFTPIGADPIQVYPIFNGNGVPIDGVTQFASSSTTVAESQDGFPMGVLQAFAFDASGTLQGVYSNGLNQPLARLALAVFANPSGLQRNGNNMWVATANSGVPRLSAPREGGAGEIIGGSLEQSNVDAATEFTELIIAQRSFQACSRIITAQDAILQEVVNLVR
jgi:flagellar hook protein FlgE